MSDLRELREAYGLFKTKRPPSGFGLIAEQTQTLVDLLDGDISGLVQLRLSGAEAGSSLSDWQLRLHTARQHLAQCEAKVQEVKAHLSLLESLSASLAANVRPGR